MNLAINWRLKMKANAQKIADGVYWVGVLDWDLRTYHGWLNPWI